MHRISAITTFFGGLLLLQASYAATNKEELEEYRQDCQIEGKEAGLTGNNLKTFIKECVADLASVTFSNTARPKGKK